MLINFRRGIIRNNIISIFEANPHSVLMVYELGEML